MVVIVSKLDRARSMYVDTLFAVRDALRTRRATKEARTELNEAREKSLSTGVCPYCGKQIILSRSLRHTEACDECGKKIDRMLGYKSKAISGTDNIEVYKALLEDYSNAEKLPYALRGASGNTQDIIDALNVAINAYANYRAEYRAQAAREARIHVESTRRKEILDLLVQCGADPESEETQQRVDEIYYDRYGNE